MNPRDDAIGHKRLYKPEDVEFDLERFISGARSTARCLENDWVVTDRETGRVLGGCGLIMNRLIDLLVGEEYPSNENGVQP